MKWAKCLRRVPKSQELLKLGRLRRSGRRPFSPPMGTPCHRHSAPDDCLLARVGEPSAGVEGDPPEPPDQFVGVVGHDLVGQRGDPNVRVQRFEGLLRRERLVGAYAGVVVQDLPVRVGSSRGCFSTAGAASLVLEAASAAECVHPKGS